MDALTPGGKVEASYRVVCLDLDVRLSATGHHHVLAVETRQADGMRQRWTSGRAIGAIRDGARFMLEAATEAEASLEPGLCPICPFVTLRAEGPGWLPDCSEAS